MIDYTDAYVAIAAWGLTYILGLLFARWGLASWRSALPAFAAVISISLRASLDTVAAEGGLSWATLAHGVVAGCLAVAGHSQWREVMKRLGFPSVAEEVRPDDDAPD